MSAPGDGGARCAWCGTDPEYVRYHDEEWGFPCADDRRLFEKICLEGFQCGLSWLVILRKRAAFRRAFSGFDPLVVSEFGRDEIDRLLADEGIVRHRRKIESAVNNAGRALELAREFGSLAAYFWGYEDRRPYGGELASTPVSRELSRDLRARGWTWVGPTTAHAFMQAMGLVNDHIPGCPTGERVVRARANFELD